MLNYSFSSRRAEFIFFSASSKALHLYISYLIDSVTSLCSNTSNLSSWFLFKISMISLSNLSLLTFYPFSSCCNYKFSLYNCPFSTINSCILLVNENICCCDERIYYRNISFSYCMAYAYCVRYSPSLSLSLLFSLSLLTSWS